MAWIHTSRQHLPDPTLAAILAQSADALAAGGSLDTALTRLLSGTAQVAATAPHLALIRLIDPDTHAARQDVRGDGTPSRARDSIPVDKGIMGRVLRRGTAEAIRDVRQDRDYLARDGAVRSEAALPLVLGGRCWGVLNVESTRVGHFDSSRMAALHLIAQHAALLTLTDAVRADLDRVHVAHERHVDIDALQAALAASVEAALAVLPGREATVEVLALSRDGEALVTLALASGNAAYQLPGRFGRGSTLAWQAVDGGQLLAKAELTLDDPRTDMADSRAALALPLHSADGAVIGVLNVETPHPHALDGAEVALAPSSARCEQVLRAAEAGALERATSFDAAIRNVVEAMGRIDGGSDGNLDHFYGLVARRAAQLIGERDIMAALLLVEQGQFTLVPARTYQYEGVLARPRAWPIEQGIAGRAIRDRTPVLVADVRHEPADSPVTASIACEFDIPLLAGDTPLGVLSIGCPRPSAITQVHRTQLEILAQQVVQALERVEQLRRGRIAQEHLALIADTNRAIERLLAVTGPTPTAQLTAVRTARERILRQLLESALGETGSTLGAVMLAIDIPPGRGRIQAAPQELVTKLVEPEQRRTEVPLHWPATHGVTGEALQTGARVVLPNVGERKRAGTFIPVFGDDVVSELAVPINNGTGVIGVLNLESITPLSYTPEQLDWVELLASQMANVISTANLHLIRSQQQQLIDLEARLVRASRGSEEAFINPEMQQAILETALDVTEQRDDGFAELWLLRRGVLRRHGFVQDGRFSSEVAGDREPGQAGIVRLAYDDGAPLLVLDVREEPWASVVKLNWPHTRSELAVPLIDREAERARVIGVLNLESRRPLDLSDRDLRIVELIGQATVAALKNRELYRAKADLLNDVTHALQKAIWPLRPVAFDLLERSGDAVHATEPVGMYHEQLAQVAALSDMASNLLGWFQKLVITERDSAAAEMAVESIGDLVAALVERMLPFARSRGKSLAIEVTPGLPLIRCAGDLIQAALFLLIDNALRYGPSGDAIRVRAVAARDAVRIEVTDHGDPLPDAEREAVFERGYRGAGTARAGSAGDAASGIGLDHVRRIVVELHGGTATYERRPSENVFAISLPTTARPDGDPKVTIGER